MSTSLLSEGVWKALVSRLESVLGYYVIQRLTIFGREKIIMKILHCDLVNGLTNLVLRKHTGGGPLGDRGTRGGNNAGKPRTPGSGSSSALVGGRGGGDGSRGTRGYVGLL